MTVSVLRAAVGEVSESDVALAAGAGALILAFGVGTGADCRALAQAQSIEIRLYTVIYRVVEDVRAAMEDMLAPDEVDEPCGVAEVREIYRASRVGVIAGCHVTDGKLTRGGRVRLRRADTIVYDGEIASLQHAKNDVGEVSAGFDCGVVLASGPDVELGDLIEAYTIRLVKRTL